MAKRKIKKHMRPALRRLIITGPICIFLIVYSIYTISTYALKIYNLKKEKNTLESNLVSLNETKKELESELVKLKDPDYLAKYARENYLYSKNDEYIIKIDEAKDELNKVNNEYNKNIIVGITVGAVALITIVIVIPKKKKKKKS